MYISIVDGRQNGPFQTPSMGSDWRQPTAPIHPGSLGPRSLPGAGLFFSVRGDYGKSVAFTALDQAEYINLRSYKRDGSAVDTPVWCAPLDGKLVIFTLRESFKVKRVQRNPKVQAARCDLRGKLLGPWQDGTCRALEDPMHEARAYAALTLKYGWRMRVGDFFSALTGRKRRRVVMEITPGQD
jgi:PPOX class probable F420-dependent enzyme